MLNVKFLKIGLVSAVLISAFSVSSLDAAKVYTWKDASGVTHYSDKPFPRVKNAKTIQVKAARPKGDDDESGSENEGTKRELFDAGDSKRLKAECSQARNNLVTLASGKNISRTNAEGEKITLDESGVQAEVQKNQVFINSYCRSNEISSSPVESNDPTNDS